MVYDETNELTNRLLHGPAIDQVLADEQFINGLFDKILWPLTDHLGSVRDLVDSDGNIENHILYDSFGNIISETDSSIDHLFGYTGRETDEETDLYYYRARYYDAEVGRFISEDPIGFSAGDVNIVRYVGNSPANAVDPYGLAEDLVVKLPKTGGTWLNSDGSKSVRGDGWFVRNDPIEVGPRKVWYLRFIQDVPIFDPYVATIQTKQGLKKAITWIEITLDNVDDPDKHYRAADSAFANQACSSSDLKHQKSIKSYIRQLRESGSGGVKYVWHHDERGMQLIKDSEGRIVKVKMKMQLTYSDIHSVGMGSGAFPHTGGDSIAARVLGKTEDELEEMLRALDQQAKSASNDQSARSSLRRRLEAAVKSSPGAGSRIGSLAKGPRVMKGGSLVEHPTFKALKVLALVGMILKVNQVYGSVDDPKALEGMDDVIRKYDKCLEVRRHAQRAGLDSQVSYKGNLLDFSSSLTAWMRTAGFDDTEVGTVATFLNYKILALKPGDFPLGSVNDQIDNMSPGDLVERVYGN